MKKACILQPKGFIVKGMKYKVYKISKAFYGLLQALDACTIFYWIKTYRILCWKDVRMIETSIPKLKRFVNYVGVSKNNQLMLRGILRSLELKIAT